jgi:hypothetical protein
MTRKQILIPSNIQNPNIDMTDILNCPICNNILVKTEKTTQYIDECYECGQDDRPFNMCRPNRNPCSCSWIHTDVIEISCIHCIETNKQEEIQAEIQKKQDIENQKNKEFIGKWTNGIVGKLECYGLYKLRILAERKNVINCSKMSKIEIINKLESITSNSDFPIRI